MFKLTVSLFLFGFISWTNLHSSETVINGDLKEFDGKIIRAASYTDYLTFKKIYLDKTSIDDSKFKLVFDIQETTQIIIRLEDKETTLFAEPGKVYNITLSYNASKNSGQAYNQLLDLSFPFPNPDNINLKIKTFNKSYQDFFANNYRQFVIKAAGKQISAFSKKWEEKNKSEENEFVKSYITYALANLKDINNNPKEALFKKYLNNQPILYSNKEYMNFFKQFYQQDFESLTLKKEANQLLHAIMIDNDLNKSLEQVNQLKRFEDISLAELYLINGLFEVYHSKTINQKSSLKLLSNIQKNGSTAESKNIAKQVISQLNQFEKGGKAPSFVLKNDVGNTIRLEDFQGKPTYLNFWANWSIPSLRELKVMETLHQKYGDKINFVSINLDEDSAVFKKVKKKNQYSWSFLHYGEDFELREKYDVRTVPTYYLIDPESKIIKANAKGPTEIERTLYELSQ